MTAAGDSTTTPVLEARDLAVSVGDRELVRVGHLALLKGEVRVLLGPNGAGKTTLLRAMNGLTEATGELSFEGRPVAGARERLRLRRRTAAVFQHAYLLSTSVRGNVESGLRMRGVRGGALRERATAAMEMLGIEHLADRRRRGLSGGEAQRVSIARALAVDPLVLFLDEPMASLDPPTRRALLADLQRIFAELSTAVLWVTHDIEEALEVADEVTFLADGKVVQDGSVAEVLNNPAADVVAGYLGIDVWLEGQVEVAVGDEATATFVLPGGGTLQCTDAEPGPAFACIHPEDVILFLRPPEATTSSLRNVVAGTVSAIRPARRSFLVSVDWGGNRIDALLTRAACEDLGLATGLRVYAAVKASAIRTVGRAAAPGPVDR